MEIYYLLVLILIIIGCYFLYTYVIYPLMHPLDSLKKVGEEVEKALENTAQDFIEGKGPGSALVPLVLDGSTSYKDYLETKAFGPDVQDAMRGITTKKEGDGCTIGEYGKREGIIQNGKCIWNGICNEGTTKNNDKCISNDYNKECAGFIPGLLYKYSENGSCLESNDCQSNFEKINNVCIYKDKCKICRTDELGIIYKYNKYGKCPTNAMLINPDIEPECPPEFPGPKSQVDCQPNFNFVSGNPSKCIYKNKDQVCTTTLSNFIGKYDEFGDCIKNSNNQCAKDYNLVDGKCVSMKIGNPCLFGNVPGKIVDYGFGAMCVEDQCKSRPNEYETVNNECLYKNRNKPCEVDIYGVKLPGIYTNDGYCNTTTGLIGV